MSLFQKEDMCSLLIFSFVLTFPFMLWYVQWSVIGLQTDIVFSCCRFWYLPVFGFSGWSVAVLLCRCSKQVIYNNTRSGIKINSPFVWFRLSILCTIYVVLWHIICISLVCRSQVFHYSAGMSTGMIASLLILIFIIYRFLPKVGESCETELNIPIFIILLIISLLFNILLFLACRKAHSICWWLAAGRFRSTLFSWCLGISKWFLQITGIWLSVREHCQNIVLCFVKLHLG